MRLEFYRLAEDIIRLAGNKPVIYVSNDGNWGDALIHAGTLAFFRHFNIKYKELPVSYSALQRNLMLLKAKLNGQLIVLAGGGAWCGHYGQMARASKNMVERYNFNNFLVLPSSYDKTYNIKGIIFYCRDQFESQKNMPTAKFCHDMAFFLEPLQCNTEPTKGIANSFRVDIESGGEITLPHDNYDLSSKGRHDDDIYGFFQYISQFSVINTDRLHVSIGASLLGKEVNLYEGSYFKNNAIFKTSLKNSYPSTKFISAEGRK